MSPRRSVLWVLAAAGVSALGPLTACAGQETVYSSGHGPRIEGSGQAGEQRRSLPAFSRLRLEDSFDVVARAGSAPQATVRTDDNLLDLVETVVENDTLVLRYKRNASFRSRLPLQVQVQYSRLQAADIRGSGDLLLEGPRGDALQVAISGSGDLRLHNAQLKQLTVSISGSGDVSASGQTDTLQASIAGSGDLNTLALQAREATVSIAGSGDAKVHASEALTVSIAGSGDVRYSGKPGRVNRRIVGSGEVSALD